MLEFIHIERLETRSAPHNWKIKPHFHPLLCQIFVLESGSGVILFEKKEIHYVGPCIICIPENSEHGFHFTSDSDGSVVTFSCQLLDKLFINSPKAKLEFTQIKIIEIKNQSQHFDHLKLSVSQINAELLTSAPEQNLMVSALLTTFLIEIYRISQIQNTSLIMQKNKSLNIYYSFQKSIVSSHNPQKNIAEYATNMNISPLHLNRVCKEVNQKTATNVINDYFLAEAQKYLTFSDYSISEIAYLLNFNDAAYFSRFFKKKVGLNPKDYRNSNKINSI